MDNNTLLTVVVVVFALIVLAAILRFRRGNISAEVKGPMDTSLKLDASHQQPTLGARVEDARSHAGSIRADDRTGRGAAVTRAEAQQDIVAASGRPDDISDPKA